MIDHVHTFTPGVDTVQYHFSGVPYNPYGPEESDPVDMLQNMNFFPTDLLQMGAGGFNNVCPEPPIESLPEVVRPTSAHYLANFDQSKYIFKYD